MCVCDIQEKREELFISSQFSLPPDLRVQQLWGKRGIANQLPEKKNKKIKLIGRPHRLLVKVWADVSTLPLELLTAQSGREKKG